MRFFFPILLISLGLLGAAMSPTPTPFAISDAELAKLTAVDIAKTRAHRDALETELNLLAASQADNLDAAIAAATAAQQSLGVYEGKVETLAADNATNFQAKTTAEKTVAEQKITIAKLWIAVAGLGISILVGGFIWLKMTFPFL